MMHEEVGGECAENHGQFAADFPLLAHQNKFSNIPSDGSTTLFMLLILLLTMVLAAILSIVNLENSLIL